jgi:hypothetical protein
MKLPPPSVLKSWPEPDYTDPVTRGPAVLIVNIVMVCIAFVVTCMRLYTRLKITFSPGIDDILIIIAMVGGNGLPGYALVLIECTGLCDCNVHGNLAGDQ